MIDPADLRLRYPLLATIDTPLDLKRLPRDRLPAVAAELRNLILEVVAQNGGHLASNLGAIELTLALHYVYDLPRDRLIWDVGHQTYAHKILTGRRDRFSTLRQFGGIAGFPRREESPYDSFGTGHSSTSLSAALGMAVAAKLQRRPTKTIAVIGDGALSAGMAFEALNNAGALEEIDLTIILNDNKMSISPPVGAITKILARLLTSRPARAARGLGGALLAAAPHLKDIARRVEEHMIGLLTPGTIFEEFGFHYIGPIDGHDLDALIPTLLNLKSAPGRYLVHTVTRKGYGYKLAEADPVRYHGVPAFDPQKGLLSPPSPPPPPLRRAPLTYTEIFSRWLLAAAARHPNLIAITPAMAEGSGLVEFARRYPDRFFDVGIAEQHAVTFAAGLAAEGYKPIVAIYSTFLQRAYDQLIHDVALQNLPVLFAVDRAGLVGADGPTHHGAFDLTFLLCIPNLTIMVPADETDCWQLLTTALLHPGPAVVRYPRAPLPSPSSLPVDDFTPLPLGQAQLRRRGRRLALLAFGPPLHALTPIAEALDATLVNMRFAKPLDTALLDTLIAEGHDHFVTVEENAAIGGAGSEIARYLARLSTPPRLLTLGLPDRFIEHGDLPRLTAQVALDTVGLRRAIERFYRPTPTAPSSTPSGVETHDPSL
ncbi:MAG: 1-deoxy-D-xylulose-5-phosphate synthase [Hydrogenophilus sp.]|nr:1-deoxy-D-xylulose-5-phosphate synthase [Hydrogenophilus sp.]